MSVNMLRPKKTHRVRNFFLIVVGLFVGIVVIASLHPAKQTITPSQTTTSSQTATQPSPTPTTAPMPAPTTTSPESSKPEQQAIHTSTPPPNTSSQTATQPSPTPTTAPTPAPTTASPESSKPEQQAIQTSDSSTRSIVVTSDEYGDRWPLTVSEARVALIGTNVAILYAEGKTYALNGIAQSRGYAPINPIWRDSPEIPGTKVSISPLIQLALGLGTEPMPEQTTSPGIPATTSTDTGDKGGSIAKRVEAWAAATMLIRDRLKAPRTAKFNGGAWNVVYLGNNRYRVKGSVDSQNSFGAMIRTEFHAIVRDKGDEHQTWVLEDLQTSP